MAMENNNVLSCSNIEIIIDGEAKSFAVELIKQSDDAFGENGYITIIASKDKNTVVYSDIHNGIIYICKKVGSGWVRNPLYIKNKLNKDDIISTGTVMSISDDSETIAVICSGHTSDKTYLCILKYVNDSYLVHDVKEHSGHSSVCVIFNGDKNIFVDIHNSISSDNPGVVVHPCPIYELSEKGNYREVQQLLIDKHVGTRFNSIAFKIEDDVITLKAHRVRVTSGTDPYEENTSTGMGKYTNMYYQYKFKRNFLLWEEFK